MDEKCDRCGHVIRFEVKRYYAFTLDSRCHRKVITDAFDTLEAIIASNWIMYRNNSGEVKAHFRDRLRANISELRALSY